MSLLQVGLEFMRLRVAVVSRSTAGFLAACKELGPKLKRMPALFHVVAAIVNLHLALENTSRRRTPGTKLASGPC
jgi:hypothetical protein